MERRMREAAIKKSRGCQRLIQVGEDVLDVFDADRKAHIARVLRLGLLSGSAANGWWWPGDRELIAHRRIGA